MDQWLVGIRWMYVGFEIPTVLTVKKTIVGMYHHAVQKKLTSVSEEHATSILRISEEHIAQLAGCFY
jgi:hypothetical protein